MGGDDRGPRECHEAIKRSGHNDLAKALRRPLHLRLPRCPTVPSTRGRSDEKKARDHKEDLVGPAAQQVNKTEHAGIGEGGKRRVFRQADAGRLEGPLKRVEYRDAGDRD